jgi:hypothetical protein
VWAAALGLFLVASVRGGEPARLDLIPTASAPVSNQQIADAIAARLRQSGQLHHYRVDVSVREGVAEVSGSVADSSQREEALRVAQGVSGVERVVDRLTLTSAITPVQAPAPAPGRLPAPLPVTPPPAAGGPAVNGAPTEAMPIFQAPAPSPYDLNPPKMPPYAWPTYAPYNNYSRVGYPSAYPYGAWPFIGPIYPFPKVPLGWRSVKLEWDDGYWWFSKVGNKHDWWKLRYW